MQGNPRGMMSAQDWAMLWAGTIAAAIPFVIQTNNHQWIWARCQLGPKLALRENLPASQTSNPSSPHHEKKPRGWGEREKWMSHQCGKPQLAPIMSKTLFSLDSPLALIPNKKRFFKEVYCCCCCRCSRSLRPPRLPPQRSSNCFSQDQKIVRGKWRWNRGEVGRGWFDFDWASLRGCRNVPVVSRSLGLLLMQESAVTPLDHPRTPCFLLLIQCRPSAPFPYYCRLTGIMCHPYLHLGYENILLWHWKSKMNRASSAMTQPLGAHCSHIIHII